MSLTYINVLSKPTFTLFMLWLHHPRDFWQRLEEIFHYRNHPPSTLLSCNYSLWNVTITCKSDLSAMRTVPCEKLSFSGQKVALMPVLEVWFPTHVKICRLLLDIMPCNDFIRLNCHQKGRRKEVEGREHWVGNHAWLNSLQQTSTHFSLSCVSLFIKRLCKKTLMPWILADYMLKLIKTVICVDEIPGRTWDENKIVLLSLCVVLVGARK